MNKMKELTLSDMNYNPETDPSPTFRKINEMIRQINKITEWINTFQSDEKEKGSILQFLDEGEK